MIEFSCPSCQTHYRVPMDKAGARGNCKQCGAEIVVPQVGVGPDEADDPLAQMTQAAGAPGDRAGQASRPRRYGSPPVNEILAARPMSAAREESVRKRNILIVGILLLLGFVLPVLVPTSSTSVMLMFPNIEGLGQSPDVVTAISLLTPLVAGIAAIAISQALGVPGRGWALLVLGLVPILLNLILAVQSGELPGLGRAMRRGGGIMLIMMLLLLTGYYCLFIGSRVRWHRPNKAAAYTVGVIGAIAMLLFMCIPIEGYPFILGAVLAITQAPLIGFVLLIAVGCLIFASILCLANTPSQAQRRASTRARVANILTNVSLLAVLVLVTMAAGIARPGFSGLDMAVLIVAFLKVLTLAGAIIVLAPMGIVDLMIGPTQKPGHCYQCDYDLRGNVSGVCPECGYANGAPA